MGNENEQRPHRPSQVAIGGLLVFFSISLFALPAIQRIDVFPFFLWNLFHQADGHRTIYFLEVRPAGQPDFCRWEDCADLPPWARGKRLFFWLQRVARTGFPEQDLRLFEKRLADLIKAPFEYRISSAMVSLPATTLQPELKLLRQGQVSP